MRIAIMRIFFLATIYLHTFINALEITGSTAGTTSMSATSPIVSFTTTTTPTAETPSGTSVSISVTSTENIPAVVPTPGPTNKPYTPGTVDCLTMPYCPDNQECFVLKDGLVCQDKILNQGYILSRNDSGVPAVPGWSGRRSALNADCTLFPIPTSTGLAMMVYDLIQGTLPRDLLLSRYDQSKTTWYTAFSNCEPELACMMSKCQPRPSLGQQCTSSWQCNPQALGLNENNSPIPGTNATEIRCEFAAGDMSENKTCQLLHREVHTGGGFSAWHVILPVVGLLVLIYFGAVIYQRRIRRDKLRKWSRAVEEDRNDFQMEAYDELETTRGNNIYTNI